MNVSKYSLKTWIIVLVLAGLSVLVDVLLVSGVLAPNNPMIRTGCEITLVIGLMGIYYGIRGIIYHTKKDKVEK